MDIPGGLRRTALAASFLFVTVSPPAVGQQVRVLKLKHDPYGFPRPGAGHVHVPLKTSFYLELGVDSPDDTVLPESVRVWLKPEGGERCSLLDPGRRFGAGCSGRLFPRKNQHGKRSLAVFIEREDELRPQTLYMVGVAARSARRKEVGLLDRVWSFTTEGAPTVHALDFELDLAKSPVRWRGGFFTGFCKASFCTSHGNRIPTYELMARVRKESPRAWSLQRDFWMTGMQHRPEFLSGNLPNVVRELETRRITAMDEGEGHVTLHLEDFFGHEQYGIPAGRALTADYHPGDEVLIADGIHDARTTVIAADDATTTLRVNPFAAPEGGWRLDYEGPLPVREDPGTPGLFPPGGCYLLKFRPFGTPRYFWGRLDKEFDLAHRRFGRRLVPNFADAPGDCAVDGRNWTRPKDYVQYHGVVHAITSHLIKRYGASCPEFIWSVFNEPDLGGLFWRSDWTELQRFYDYTADAVLRAFEDQGYDSQRVVIGGLELAAIFGTNLRLREFLEHCSPSAVGTKALRLNAAFADPRLEGRRSQRVERLCRAHEGMGSPCDFISIHAYNRPGLMAAKLIRAKEIALQVDAAFYADLRVHSHESCPGWNPPPDPAALDSYLGNGYFPTWCADVARRLLAKGARDKRYTSGETILTFWPWPNTNFEGVNASTRVVHVDDDGDGAEDRTVTVAMPILHFLGLTAGMADRYWVLEERVVGGHVVSGFGARSGDVLKVLLYAHDPLDTESRSGQSFRVNCAVKGLAGSRLAVTEYGFDTERNSYFELGRRLREETRAREATLSPSDRKVLDEATVLLDRRDRASRLEGLKRVRALGRRAKSTASLVIALIHGAADTEVKHEATATLLSLHAPAVYPAGTVAEVQKRSELKGRRYILAGGPDVKLSVRLSANAACFLVVEPAPPGELPPPGDRRPSD